MKKMNNIQKYEEVGEKKSHEIPTSEVSINNKILLALF